MVVRRAGESDRGLFVPVAFGGLSLAVLIGGAALRLDIAGLALGPLVRPGAKVTRRMTHYDLLRTIEAAWRLPPLGLSATAKPVTSIWR